MFTVADLLTVRPQSTLLNLKFSKRIHSYVRTFVCNKDTIAVDGSLSDKIFKPVGIKLYFVDVSKEYTCFVCFCLMFYIFKVMDMLVVTERKLKNRNTLLKAQSTMVYYLYLELLNIMERASARSVST